MIKSASQLKTQAIELLGEDKFNAAIEMSIVDLHKTLYKAYLRNTRGKEMRGYDMIIAYREMGGLK